ncbi:hypothetical protein E2C01_091617 [Portunus trituberculatus]|uniref:Uncharacterized protein n=1 Tax=Portunus trituberculatus TaxID=210409 RepID=A0A5B7JHZ6_PORTR|nr:hypothetical protein [Portunus trituberculatus]
MSSESGSDLIKNSYTKAFLAALTHVLDPRHTVCPSLAPESYPPLDITCRPGLRVFDALAKLKNYAPWGLSLKVHPGPVARGQ